MILSTPDVIGERRVVRELRTSKFHRTPEGLWVPVEGTDASIGDPRADLPELRHTYIYDLRVDQSADGTYELHVNREVDPAIFAQANVFPDDATMVDLRTP